MDPPRFVRNEEALLAVSREAKGWACPHCRAVGRLNRHGALRGLAEDGSKKTAVRGQRFFCSNRGRRPGCGRTFAIRPRQVIAEATVRSGLLWRFYWGRATGQSVLEAWAALRSGFSLEAAYRWWRRWQRGLPALRTVLARGRDPPRGELVTALVTQYGPDDPIGAFQDREQCGWP